MNVARWAVWTLMALAALSALPFRHGGPLAAVRWGLAAAATVLFVLWLWAGARAIGRAVRGRPAQGTWPARVGGVVSGAVPWLLAVSLIAGRCAAVRATRPAVTPEREEAARRMERCIRVLACEIGERHALGRLEALQRAGNWIESEFTASGWQVRREVFEIPSAGGIVEVANLIAERRGRVRPGEIVLVGAHYDTAPGTPGANDNASGVAALLELAWRWRALEPDRTLRLVAFTNEEPPWFMTSHMGSEVYAAGIAARGERVVLMVALETIGCFRNERGSQE